MAVDDRLVGVEARNRSSIDHETPGEIRERSSLLDGSGLTGVSTQLIEGELGKCLSSPVSRWTTTTPTTSCGRDFLGTVVRSGASMRSVGVTSATIVRSTGRSSSRRMDVLLARALANVAHDAVRPLGSWGVLEG